MAIKQRTKEEMAVYFAEKMMAMSEKNKRMVEMLDSIKEMARHDDLTGIEELFMMSKDEY